MLADWTRPRTAQGVVDVWAQRGVPKRPLSSVKARVRDQAEPPSAEIRSGEARGMSPRGFGGPIGFNRGAETRAGDSLASPLPVQLKNRLR